MNPRWGEGDVFLVKGFCADHGLAHLTYAALNANIEQHGGYIPREQMLYTVPATGQQVQIPRDKAIVGNVTSGLEPNYPYDETIRRIKPVPPMAQKVLHVLQAMGYILNHIVINRYLKPEDHIGYHQDKSRSFLKGSFICTVSIGGARTLELKHKTDSNRPVQKIVLEHGSLLMLGWKTNEQWLHRIVPESSQSSAKPRISLTCRAITTAFDPTTDRLNHNTITIPPHPTTVPEGVVMGPPKPADGPMARFVKKRKEPPVVSSNTPESRRSPVLEAVRQRLDTHVTDYIVVPTAPGTTTVLPEQWQPIVEAHDHPFNRRMVRQVGSRWVWKVTPETQYDVSNWKMHFTDGGRGVLWTMDEYTHGPEPPAEPTDDEIAAMADGPAGAPSGQELNRERGPQSIE